MEQPATDDETLILTTKDGRRVTISSRVLLQRTTNNKTTESYHYDADGKLTAAEADIKTWEERNTEIYRWINEAPPPFDVSQRRLQAAPRARTVPPDDPGLVRMATAVHRVPALSWTGTMAKTSTNDDQGHELESRVAGRQRSQSEHSVSMKTSSVEARKQPRPGPKFHAGKVVTPVPPRAHVWTPPQAKLQPSTAAGHRGIANGPLKGRTVAAPSLAERHTRRCMENRRRKQTAYQRGVDY